MQIPVNKGSSGIHEGTHFALDEGTEASFRIADSFYRLDGSILGEVFEQRLRDFLLVHIGREAVRDNVSTASQGKAPKAEKYSRRGVKFTYLATKTLALCGCLLSVRVPPAGEESTRD